ncbi:MAG: RNA polymerase sigma factor [Deltaproteobacteria bacterium]|nr:RNA polymerase sigma factor [Deltaproteobacteria bacterium]
MGKQQTLDNFETAALQAGERDAIAKLFCDNRHKLLGLALRLMGSASEAEDVVQDAFVQTLRHHHQFQGNARPSTWLYRVTFNAALMRLRTRRRKGALSLDALPPEVAETAVHHARDVDGMSCDPEALCLRRAADADVIRALARLKPVDQRLVQLRYGEGLSTEDVGTQIGMSTSAVKTRLHRARMALKGVVDAPCGPGRLGAADERASCAA